MLSFRTSSLFTLATAAAMLVGCNQNNTVDPKTSDELTRPVAGFAIQDAAAPQEAAPPAAEPTQTSPENLYVDLAAETAPAQTAPAQTVSEPAQPAATTGSAEDLAQAKNCLSCHRIDSKLVGPSYKDVAAKYAGQNAVDTLAEKVIKGGSGVWGPMPMTPNNVTPEEAKQLVTWILSLK
jgi:cytochrome c